MRPGGPTVMTRRPCPPSGARAIRLAKVAYGRAGHLAGADPGRADRGSAAVEAVRRSDGRHPAAGRTPGAADSGSGVHALGRSRRLQGGEALGRSSRTAGERWSWAEFVHVSVSAQNRTSVAGGGDPLVPVQSMVVGGGDASEFAPFHFEDEAGSSMMPPQAKTIRPELAQDCPDGASTAGRRAAAALERRPTPQWPAACHETPVAGQKHHAADPESLRPGVHQLRES